MVNYLQMDGEKDYLVTPSITFNKIEIDMYVDNAMGKAQTYFDARSGNLLAYLSRDVNNLEIWLILVLNVTVNGIAKLPSSNVIPSKKRSVVTVNLLTPVKDSVAIFAKKDKTEHVKGMLYGVKFFNNSTMVANYDMQSRTVQDQSGNGNDATASSGTWATDTPNIVDAGDLIGTVETNADLTANNIRYQMGTATAESDAKMLATANVSTTYLQLDGVDDRILTPSLTYTKIIFDVDIPSLATGAPFAYVFDPSVRSNSHLRLTGTGYSGAGTTTGDIVNARTMLTSTAVARITYRVSIGSRFDGANNFLKAKLYSVQFYNDETLVAHYDMSTGTVQDQSGNEKHASLTGGTWVNDAPTTGQVIDAGTLTGTVEINATVENSNVYNGLTSGSVETNATGTANKTIYNQMLGSVETDVSVIANKTIKGEANGTVESNATYETDKTVFGEAMGTIEVNGESIANRITTGEVIGTFGSNGVIEGARILGFAATGSFGNDASAIATTIANGITTGVLEISAETTGTRFITGESFGISTSNASIASDSVVMGVTTGSAFTEATVNGIILLTGVGIGVAISDGLVTVEDDLYVKVIRGELFIIRKQHSESKIIRKVVGEVVL